MTDLVVRLRKQATCVYLAAEAGPAADLSDGLTKAADEIERLQSEIRTLRNFLGGIKSNVDLALADYPDVPTGLVKRPVAWRVKDCADGWIIYQDEGAAYRDSEDRGALMQGLYVRDGT